MSVAPRAAGSELAPASSSRGAWLILGALLVGLVLGVLVGKSGDGWREPVVQVASLVGGLWLDGLRMTVIPLVIALLVNGIVGSADAARAGGITAKAIAWFMGFYIFSSAVGGFGMKLLTDLFPLPAQGAAALRAGLAGIDQSQTANAVPTVADFFKSIIPPNPVAAAANDQILPLVVFTVIFAFALAKVGSDNRRVALSFFQAIGDAMLRVIGWVLWLAPAGVLALAFTVGAGAGGSALGAVAHYVVLVSLLGVVVTLAALAVGLLLARVPPGRLLSAMVGPAAVAISTRSSLASLPAMLEAARRLGVDEGKADILLPMAVALLRATGPAMNVGVAVYVAHWFGIALPLPALIAGIAIGALASIGAVSLPGQLSFYTSIAPISLAMGVPIEPLALLIAVETIPDIFRTLGNVIADVSVTAAIARSEGDDLTAERPLDDGGTPLVDLPSVSEGR
ncbi:dicarboxylate/amino acid:cation symporter [Sphingomonas sp. KRR8]|uniref:dicarboxylate/amino acid:cation symporter n=1 Tax=Sphingomonas sp. KRR8 TaxID=2942996 RepID=UPI00202234E4|nr:cation:dicarboxylase symporter family transporter [Sphingomonas sp. KRR8]URD62259.1 dicarboxylate/amino acid:cation symporter [Sphingomonas sp. KRR8]